MKWYSSNQILYAGISILLSAGAYLYLNQNAIDKRLVAVENIIYLTSKNYDEKISAIIESQRDMNMKLDKMNDLLLHNIVRPVASLNHVNEPISPVALNVDVPFAITHLDCCPLKISHA